MTDEMKKAFDFAADLTKQLITLATGIIGLTITFTKDFLKGAPVSAHPFAFWAWYMFLASIAMGILTLSTMTGNLAKTTNPTLCWKHDLSFHFAICHIRDWPAPDRNFCCTKHLTSIARKRSGYSN